jgi:2-amino-4-hydroxy-6-hydroxymethyldihydropteridine diphosphokinase
LTADRPAPVLIALGSNIEPVRNLPRAISLLNRDCPVEAVSPVYAAEPVGRPEAPMFLNAAARIETILSPQDLKFGVLRPLEEKLGRRRSADRYAPRTIDVDIAFFGSLVIDDPDRGLVIPDPDIGTCAHLALPLADLEPLFRHPLSGETLSQLAADFADSDSIRLFDGLRLQPG